MPNNTLVETLQREAREKAYTCRVCRGDGYTVEHDPTDPTGETPMQVQCDDCHAEGKYLTLDNLDEIIQTTVTKAVEAGRRSQRLGQVKDVRDQVRRKKEHGLAMYEKGKRDALPPNN